jgi:hypothetical protein
VARDNAAAAGLLSSKEKLACGTITVRAAVRGWR